MSELNFTSYGSGPPLVMVHGLAGSTRWWRRNLRALGRHFTVHLLDLPGFGLSSSAQPLEQVVASLPAWLNWIGLDRVRLVGHSMGGYVALHLAATHPERVERLALIDAVGIPIRANVRQMIGRVFRSARHGSASFIPTVLSDGLRAGVPTLLRLTNEILELDARPMLPAVQAPTLVLWGTRDELLPPDMGVTMAKLIPSATFHYIPKAGHNAMADRPALVNQYLIDFMSPHPTLEAGTDSGEANGRIM